MFYLRNEFNFWNVHGTMNTAGLLTLQETRSIHDSMNRSKMEFIFYICIYHKYLNIKIIFNLGIKTVLYLRYNRFNSFVGV